MVGGGSSDKKELRLRKNELGADFCDPPGHMTFLMISRGRPSIRSKTEHA